MKIQIASDLHLEFQDVVINNAGADVLCLAGDICLADHLYRNSNSSYIQTATRYRNFFADICSKFPKVLYIMGNHEHYSGLWNRTSTVLFNECKSYGNLIFLDNESVDIEGIRFIGTSLWTDLNNEDPLTMMSVKSMINDYHAITINHNAVYHKLSPINTVSAHKNALDYINIAYNEHDGPVVILGHHAPSYQSIHERYKNEHIMNGAFCSNLDEFILSRNRIKLWIHGHVHNPFDYYIGDTRIVCNPHGYPNEHKDFNPGLVIEI